MGRARVKNKRCRYSDSCFKCPLRDCTMSNPLQLNRLPLDLKKNETEGDERVEH